MISYNDAMNILGVDANFTPSQLKKAYKSLANKYHPDKPSGNSKKFNDVMSAYNLLKSPSPNKHHGSPIWTPPKSEPIKYEISISLKSSVSDMNIVIGGKSITIPPTRHNTKYIISDILGYDSVLVVSVLNDSKFEVNGNDLIYRCNINALRAMTGESLYIPHPNGEIINIFVDSPTKSGRVIKVSGKGLPKTHNKSRGDLYVIIEVSIPDLTEEQKQVIIGVIDKLKL